MEEEGGWGDKKERKFFGSCRLRLHDDVFLDDVLSFGCFLGGFKKKEIRHLFLIIAYTSFILFQNTFYIVPFQTSSFIDSPLLCLYQVIHKHTHTQSPCGIVRLSIRPFSLILTASVMNKEKEHTAM